MGDWDDPARAMSRLSHRITDAVSPASLLPAVVEAVGQALRLSYVAVQLDGDTACRSRRTEPSAGSRTASSW